MTDYVAELRTAADRFRHMATSAEADGQQLLAMTATFLADRCIDAIRLVSYTAALDVVCPSCAADVGEQCLTIAGYTHALRVQRAATVTRDANAAARKELR